MSCVSDKCGGVRHRLSNLKLPLLPCTYSHQTGDFASIQLAQWLAGVYSGPTRSPFKAMEPGLIQVVLYLRGKGWGVVEGLPCFCQSDIY